SRTRARNRSPRRKRRGLSRGKLTGGLRLLRLARARYSSSSPKKNWSEHLLVQKIRPMLRIPQLSHTHLKQMGHLLRRES
ncbi:MAG TPA: hypothetical protein VN083_02175, partial [Vicinamibacteria bacterium]|nr:hypothetical protein [Vicinamibacteria bacterium]